MQLASCAGRLGQTYTLDELAAAYPDADGGWRDLVDDADPAPRSSRDLAGTIARAAFLCLCRAARRTTGR